MGKKLQNLYPKIYIQFVAPQSTLPYLSNIYTYFFASIFPYLSVLFAKKIVSDLFYLIQSLYMEMGLGATGNLNKYVKTMKYI